MDQEKEIIPQEDGIVHHQMRFEKSDAYGDIHTFVCSCGYRNEKAVGPKSVIADSHAFRVVAAALGLEFSLEPELERV